MEWILVFIIALAGWAFKAGKRNGTAEVSQPDDAVVYRERKIFTGSTTHAA